MMKRFLYAALAAGFLSLGTPALAQQPTLRQSLDFLRSGKPLAPEQRAAPIFENIGQATAKDNSLEMRVQTISARTGIDIPPFMVSMVRFYSEILTDYQELQRFERSYLKLSLVEQKSVTATLYFYQKPSFPDIPDPQAFPMYLHVQVRMQ